MQQTEQLKIAGPDSRPVPVTDFVRSRVFSWLAKNVPEYISEFCNVIFTSPKRGMKHLLLRVNLKCQFAGFLPSDCQTLIAQARAQDTQAEEAHTAFFGMGRRRGESSSDELRGCVGLRSAHLQNKAVLGRKDQAHFYPKTVMCGLYKRTTTLTCDSDDNLCWDTLEGLFFEVRRHGHRIC